MKLLLDEMHAPAVAVQLRERGHDVIAVKERGELIGSHDEDILRAAAADHRALVTENVKDFAVLHRFFSAAGQQHSGLVFTHYRRFPRSAHNHIQVLTEALAVFLNEHVSLLGDVESFVWWLDRKTDELL